MALRRMQDRIVGLALCGFEVGVGGEKVYQINIKGNQAGAISWKGVCVYTGNGETKKTESTLFPKELVGGECLYVGVRLLSLTREK